MTFAFGPIAQIPTDRDDVYAFRITGHVDDDAAEAMAEFMNDVFDRHEKVSMLMDLTGFTGSDWDAMLDGDVIKSRFRALTHVHRYAVIGAPERAASMIEIMDVVIPVEAKAFDTSQEEAAWAFVGAAPIKDGSVSQPV